MVTPRKSKVGCSYLQNVSLLMQHGLFDNHRSGFLNNKVIIVSKRCYFFLLSLPLFFNVASKNH